MKRSLALSLSVLVAVMVMSRPNAALAKGLVVINTGEVAFESGPLPQPGADPGAYAGWNAGYKCSVIGAFWIYAAWWGCQPVAFKDDGVNSFTYDDSPEVAAAVEQTYHGDFKVGFWGGYMRWVILALILVGVGATIWKKKKKKA